MNVPVGINHESTPVNVLYPGAALYPDRCADIDPKAKTDEIYLSVVGGPAFDRISRLLNGMAVAKRNPEPGSDKMNDANTEWNERCELQKQITDYKSSAEFFSIQKNVDRMAKDLIEGTIDRASDQLVSLDFLAGSTVLDIGAGPGTLAVPLAKRGCRVTVVEPSHPMTVSMEKYRVRQGVSADIGVVPQLWEEVDADFIGRFDYVISSFALAVPDLREALLKMNAVATKQVHIFWFLTTPSWAQINTDLWKALHNEEYIGRPYADLIWNTLYQAGIMANLSVYPMKDSHTFADHAEALEEYADRLSAVEDWQRKIVLEYLQKTLIPCGDGRLTFPDEGRYAHIWWDTA